jgi:preprotein translocase subunit YajC
MSFFISEAWAEAPTAAAGAQQGSPFVTLIMLGVLFAAFYFILIRPQAKRAKEQKAMIAALAKGDEVVTAGGVLGRITNLGEAYVALEIAGWRSRCNGKLFRLSCPRAPLSLSKYCRNRG